MTPHELNIAVTAFGEKYMLQSENDLLSAYMTAYFHRVEKLETFETYRSKMTGKEQVPKGMSDDHMLAKVAQLNGMYGGITKHE